MSGTTAPRISTLSLHDALPILQTDFPDPVTPAIRRCGILARSATTGSPSRFLPSAIGKARSEEHTSELQSRGHLVCRLLLEKKKPNETAPQPAPGHRQRGHPGL